MKITKIEVGTVAGVVAVIILIFGAFTIIGPTDRGILHTLGKPNQEVLTPGLQFKLPIFQTIKKWSVIPTVYKVYIDIGDNGAITKDNQVIGSTFRVLYAYDDARLYEAATKFDQKTIEKAIDALAISSMKTVIGQYTIFDVAINQDTIIQQVGYRIKNNISQYPIIVSQITLENFDWSESFDQQIQQTMTAAQKVKQAEQEANITEQQMRKLKIEADAKAAALVAEADGKFRAAELNAKAAIENAKGEAASDIEIARGKNESNKLLQQNWGVELRIRELEIEKIRANNWNGKSIPDIGVMTPAGTLVPITGVREGR
jgi:regulator of protease activity HflC (stomatin/prohibitin superfamily)